MRPHTFFKQNYAFFAKWVILRDIGSKNGLKRTKYVCYVLLRCSFADKTKLTQLDEECRMPKCTDDTFTAKLHERLGWLAGYDQVFVEVLDTAGKEPDFIKPRLQFQTRFGIKHYAGDVFYFNAAFLEKNADIVQSALEAVLAIKIVL